jgi:hypothetical protein
LRVPTANRVRRQQVSTMMRPVWGNLEEGGALLPRGQPKELLILTESVC